MRSSVPMAVVAFVTAVVVVNAQLGIFVGVMAVAVVVVVPTAVLLFRRREKQVVKRLVSAPLANPLRPPVVLVRPTAWPVVVVNDAHVAVVVKVRVFVLMARPVLVLRYRLDEHRFTRFQVVSAAVCLDCHAFGWVVMLPSPFLVLLKVVAVHPL